MQRVHGTLDHMSKMIICSQLPRTIYTYSSKARQWMRVYFEMTLAFSLVFSSNAKYVTNVALIAELMKPNHANIRKGNH
jgi:hypothetical protein